MAEQHRKFHTGQMWTIQSERWKVDRELTGESSSGIWRAGEDCLVGFFLLFVVLFCFLIISRRYIGSFECLIKDYSEIYTSLQLLPECQVLERFQRWNKILGIPLASKIQEPLLIIETS